VPGHIPDEEIFDGWVLKERANWNELTELVEWVNQDVRDSQGRLVWRKGRKNDREYQ
jgi:hypothetical protein